MKNGTYRNKAGAELRVTGLWAGEGRLNTLGGIYGAVAPDQLFGPSFYLVTESVMAECGYELVAEEGDGR